MSNHPWNDLKNSPRNHNERLTQVYVTLPLPFPATMGNKIKAMEDSYRVSPFPIG